MAQKKIHDCTTHKVILCEQVKELILLRKAKIKNQSSISKAINQIVLEWAIIKDHQKI